MKTARDSADCQHAMMFTLCFPLYFTHTHISVGGGCLCAGSLLVRRFSTMDSSSDPKHRFRGCMWPQSCIFLSILKHITMVSFEVIMKFQT